jgi:hypothetical protein
MDSLATLTLTWRIALILWWRGVRMRECLGSELTKTDLDNSSDPVVERCDNEGVGEE